MNLVPRDTKKMFYSFTWKSVSKQDLVAQAYNPNYPGSLGKEAPKFQACLGKLSETLPQNENLKRGLGFRLDIKCFPDKHKNWSPIPSTTVNLLQAILSRAR